MYNATLQTFRSHNTQHLWRNIRWWRNHDAPTYFLYTLFIIAKKGSWKDHAGKTGLKMEPSDYCNRCAYHLTPKRISWYGRVMRREETHITKSALSIEMMGTRTRGWLEMRWLDQLISDVHIYMSLTEKWPLAENDSISW